MLTNTIDRLSSTELVRFGVRRALEPVPPRIEITVSPADRERAA
jgi:hypothetical protein